VAEHGYSEDVKSMAGKIAEIIGVEHGVYENRYRIDLDNGRYLWDEDEFDPGYRPDEPLSPEDAIRAMLDGETLYDKEGWKHLWDGDYFVRSNGTGSTGTNDFTSLRRRPEKRKRTMSREEMLAWSISEESHGWMVRCGEDEDWKFPNAFSYSYSPDHYQRARLLPNLSGVDPDTVQRFEAEE
jgi:hypothetical protein